MGSVYIISDYGKLGKRNEALCFSYPSGGERLIFLHRTDRLVISGSVDISAQALKLLMRHKVDTVFLSKNGQFNGRLGFQDSKNVFVRQRQYAVLGDETRRLRLAKAIAAAKMRNQITFMQRIGRKDKIPDIQPVIDDALKNLDTVLKATTLSAVRGYEGYGSRLYFSVFRHNIIPEWAIFNSRTMNPPKDNANAVMSFLYTLLMYRVDAAIETHGLDPYAGILHEIGYGKHALTYDLMEEFRASVVDPLVCALFNLNILKKDDFSECDFGPDDDTPASEDEAQEHDVNAPRVVAVRLIPVRGVLLTKDALKKVVEKFEEKMDSPIMYPPRQERMSYQQIIYAQVEHYKRVILNEEPEYCGFLVK